MIVPESVKREWKSQPTTVELLKVDLQAEKVKTKNLEALVLSLITRVQKLEAR
jgi:hypothetical protein